MLEYDNAAAHADIQFERVGDVLTIKLPNEGFARGPGNQLRSPHFWLVIALFLSDLQSPRSFRLRAARI